MAGSYWRRAPHDPLARAQQDDRRVWLIIVAIVLLSLLLLPLSQALFGLRFTYTVRVVALGGSFLGLLSGALGCFAVLRRESLLGDALSHAALPGVAIAFLLAGRELSLLLIGAGIASWLSLRFVAALLATTRLKQDAALGIVLASWFAAGIALLTYIQSIPMPAKPASITSSSGKRPPSSKAMSAWSWASA